MDDDNDDFDGPGRVLLNFGSLSIRDVNAEKEGKQASSLSIAKVPRTYVPRSITPPPLPKAIKKSEQKSEDRTKQHIRASSIPRPRAVISSPDNDQILGSKNKKRLDRPSTLTKLNMAESRQSEGRRDPSIAARKPLTGGADSRETARTSDAKGKQGSSLDVRVPRANIVKARPCFTIT